MKVDSIPIQVEVAVANTLPVDVLLGTDVKQLSNLLGRKVPRNITEKVAAGGIGMTVVTRARARQELEEEILRRGKEVHLEVQSIALDDGLPVAPVMALVSSIGSFDQSVEEWTAYVERVELYLAANAIDDAERRRAVLLSVYGASTYQLIRSLVAPAKPVFALSPSKSKPFRSTATCYRCGGQHSEASCRYKDWTCNSCGKQEARPSTCNLRRALNKQRFSRKHCNPPISIVMNVNGANIPMEVDTGAAASLISEATYKGSWASLVKPPLKCADVSLHTYSGEVLPVVGQISVTVEFPDQKQCLPLSTWDMSFRQTVSAQQKRNGRRSSTLCPHKTSVNSGRSWAF
eukprot:Em0007g1284a